MELDEDTISGRILQLNQQLMSPYCQGGTAVNSKLHVEGLQDALLALYEECGCDRLRKIPEVASFIEKFGTTVSELRSLRVKPTDFSVEAVIGRGNFGEVKLVRERGTGHYYAMKTLSKQVSQGQREASSYEEERDILALAARPGAPEWLTALQYAFQDASNLYLVMEYLPGGDLLGLLERFEHSLPEECVRFYVAEIVQAMNSLHKLGYVHRDVKPDNVLLDRCGHIKLADFGSAAKLNADGKVNRPLPVGTPEYIAPEVLQSVSDEKAVYGVECDYWSLGVLAYELVFGTTPFQGSERTRIYSNIMSHEGGEKLEFPSTSGVSRDLKTLISGLLEPAATRFTYLQVKKHKFFSGISWNTLRDSVPPYVPVIQCDNDTSNFLEPQDTQSQNVDEFRSKYSSFTGKQLPFVGFTLTPGVPITKNLQQKEPQEDVQIIREIPNKPSDHPDIIRNRELKTLREMLNDREERLKEAQTSRMQAETQLDNITRKANSYRQALEQERQDRREVEKRAVETMKSMKSRWQTEAEARQAEIRLELQKTQTKLVQEKTRASELDTRVRTREEQLTAERENSDRLQALLQKRKENMSKARRETLTLMGDAQQITELRMKLGVEQSDRRSLQEKADLLSTQVVELQAEVRKLGQQLEQSGETVDKAETLTIAAQERLKRVESRLQKETEAHNVTKAHLAEMESQAQLEHTREEQLLEASIVSLQEQLAQSETQREELSRKLGEASHKDEEQQGKVEMLEKLLGRLENRIESLEEENNKLEAAAVVATLPRTKAPDNSGEVAVLQAQLERLESQLEKAREAGVLDRQAARTAESNLYKKEKELSDAKIDLRIATRERKEVDEEVLTLRAEKEALTQNQTSAEAKVAELTSQLEGLKRELDASKVALSKSEAKLQAIREHEEELQTRHLEQSRQLGTLETRATEKAELAAKLQGELEALRKEVAAERSGARDSSSQIQQLRSQVESLQLNNNALKEACSMLDEQLEDSDKVRAAYDTQLAQAKQEVARLQEQLDKARGDFRAKSAEADELRALRAAVEERLATARRDADFRAAEALEDMKDLKQQLSEARFASDQLLQQVNELEATLCDSDRVGRDQGHIVDALRAKCTSLQEELATTLTDLQTARDAAETLSVRLEAAKQSEKETAARLTEAGAKADGLRVTNEQNILKLKATIDQQAKLIDFLQSKAVEKKKKTLADVLFGSRTKENMAPTPSPLRPAGQMQAPLSAKAAQAARERARTWEPRTPKASADTKKGPQQTPVSSKVASVTKPAEPSKPAVETKKEESAPSVNASKPEPNLNAPMILDQRVLPEYCRLTINCAVPLSEQVTLLGAEEGLYSLHPRASGFQLVHIAGVTKVKQVLTVPHLGLALFIAGSHAVLSQCELRALTVAAEAAQCSKPSVTLTPVEHAPDQCYISAVSSSMPLRESGGSTATFLCVANPSHVAIMRWNLGSCQFEPVRLLETKHPTASILFTPHSLLLVCDEIFELDLQDFSVEDFLNQADKSLNMVRTALKSKTAPGTVSLLDITKRGPKAEPEYMLCLPDIAVFLDGFGSRSRPGDLKWSHRPQAFVYSSPVLYVQHTTGVLGVRPVDSTLCASNESIATASTATSTSQELGLLPLSGPRLLGVGMRKGSVVATAHQAAATTLLTITAPGLDADDISLSSEIESGRDEFSFTSSLENSLEGDVVHDANKKVQFA